MDEFDGILCQTCRTPTEACVSPIENCVGCGAMTCGNCGSAVQGEWTCRECQTPVPDKIKFVVIYEHTLGYINPLQPNSVGILSTSVIRGAAPYSQFDGMAAMPVFPKDIRPATRSDFDAFRVSSEGYEKDAERYDFPKS